MPALSASFQSPDALAVDAAGNILVGDNGQSYAVSVVAESAAAAYGISPWAAGDVYTLSGGSGATSTTPSGNASAFEVPPVDSVGYAGSGELYVAAYNATAGSSAAALYELTDAPVPGTLSQGAPTTGSCTVGGAYSGQLNVADSVGAPAFTTTSYSPGISVSASGAISSACSTTGTFVVSGTAKDILGNGGSWTFTLTVSGVITQTGPAPGLTSAGPAVITTAETYSGQLAVSGNSGAVSYSVTSCTYNGTVEGSCPVSVSARGAISTTAGTLAAGSYVVGGTDSDPATDAGTWAFYLTVNGVTGLSCSPGSEGVVAGTAYSGQLTCAGAVGATSFTTTATDSHVAVSATGAIAAPATDPLGSYTASGSFTDSLGDSGSWAFTLIVTVAGSAPTVASVSPNDGPPAGGAVVTITGTGFVPGATDVNFEVPPGGGFTWPTCPPDCPAQGGRSPSVTVINSGLMVAVTPPESALEYPGSDGILFVIVTTPSGTTTASPASEYTYIPEVGGTLAQTGPTPGLNTASPASVTTAQAYASQLAVSGSSGTVSYTVSSCSFNSSVTLPCPIAVSTSGAISAAANSLPSGNYGVQGNDSDTAGDTGTWSLYLTVNAVTDLTCVPTSANVPAGTAFSGTLTCPGSVGVLSVATTTTDSHLAVSATGAISSAATDLVGSYSVAGTFTDALGNGGLWGFTLNVTSNLLACTPTSVSVAANTVTLYSGQLVCTGGVGTDGFTTSTTSPYLSVSPAGALSEHGTPAVGQYSVSGTVTDTLGDSSSWSFTLDVTAGPIACSPSPAGTWSTTANGPLVAPGEFELACTGVVGDDVFSVTSANAYLNISSSGAVSMVAYAPVGQYSVSGTVTDSLGDTGNWSATLKVSPGTVSLQPVSADVAIGVPMAAAQLEFTGGIGAVSCAPTATTYLSVSVSCAVTETGSPAAGTYNISGTSTDSLGDTGTWAFSLTVAQPVAVGSPASYQTTRDLFGAGTPSSPIAVVAPGVTSGGVPASPAWCANGVSFATGSPAPNGSAQAVAALTAQETAATGEQGCYSVAMSSVVPQASSSPNLQYYAYALDATSVVVGTAATAYLAPGTPAQLTLQEIRGIYTCAPGYTNWDTVQVGSTAAGVRIYGGNAPIYRFWPQPGSAEAVEMQDMLGSLSSGQATGAPFRPHHGGLQPRPRRHGLGLQQQYLQ